MARKQLHSDRSDFIVMAGSRQRETFADYNDYAAYMLTQLE